LGSLNPDVLLPSCISLSSLYEKSDSVKHRLARLHDNNHVVARAKLFLSYHPRSLDRPWCDNTVFNAIIPFAVDELKKFPSSPISPKSCSFSLASATNDNPRARSCPMSVASWGAANEDEEDSRLLFMHALPQPRLID
jgi:hypothetical protein